MANVAERNADNINSLCKKYFTTELCDEPVTETKRALELKLWTQLEKYGHKIARNYSALTSHDADDVVIFTIGECFKNWREKALQNSTYTAYYATALKNNFARENEEAGKKNSREISLSTPVKGKNDKGETTQNEPADTVEDKAMPMDSALALADDIEQKFKFIEKVFRLKKRDFWWNSLITWYFYDDLHKFFSLSNVAITRFSFIDAKLYNSSIKENQKDIAKYLGKDEGQLSRATDKFLALCMENMSDFKDDYKLQESLKEYLKDIQDKGKHKKLGEQ